jgi:acetylornithine deacetylase/succinyl-diaminopimelate desuccinylase-like protein
MMTTSSVASLRAAPTMAVYGLACGMEEPLTLMHAPNESVHPDELATMALTEALFLRRYASR